MKNNPRYLSALVLLLGFMILAAGELEGQDNDELKGLLAEAGDQDKFPGASYVVVFDRTVADVQDSGLTYVTQKRLWKVFTPSGALSLRTVSWNYDPLSGLVEVKAARIFRKDGTIEELPLEKVLDFEAPARGIYWGLRDVVLPVGRLEEGDGLFVESFRKGFTYALLHDKEDDERFIPPMRGHYYDIVNFYDSHPVMERTYTALLPKDKPVQYEVYNGEVAASVHFKGDKVAYTWTKKDIKPFEGEPNMVAQSDVATKLLVSTSPDWIAKSKWFYGVNEDFGSFDVSPDVQAKVDELLKGVTDDEEKVWILTHWCADMIRYSGVSMGQGEGYTLHKGEMTFNDRCGVCKDKAGMLVTMLRAAGFESYAAMTMAGSRIDYIPADQFNHSVTLIKLRPGLELKNNPGFGEYKLLDPTWVPYMRELWSSAEQQQQYLPGVPEGADLQTTQLSPPENHYFRLKGTSTLDSKGNLEGAFTLTAEGQSDAGLRWNLTRRRYKAVWDGYFHQVIHNLSPRAEIKSLKYPDPYDLSEPIKIEIEYRIPSYAMIAGNQMLFTPCLAKYPFSDTHSFLNMNVDLEERKYPLRDRTSRLVELSESVELPQGFEVAFLPEAETVKGDAADFEGGYEKEEGKLSFHASLALKRRIYEASEYENFSKAVKGLKHLMETQVALSR
ncbi:MAG: DUF3857 domain-containing transglutaminase family protein [Planctomycetota bacterium]|jgi:hypothetical protein